MMWKPLAQIQRVYHTLSLWLSSQLDDQKHQGTMAALDGVRAIACLMVVGYHIALMTHNTHIWSSSSIPLTSAVLLSGAAGVTLFLVLSGFLLFLPYARSLLLERPWPEVRLFYMRRALRILPAYYFALFLLVMFTHAEYLEPQNWQKLLLFVFLFQDASGLTYQQLNGPFWTLAVEWQFYLFLPWIALGIHLLVRSLRVQQRFWGVMGCLIVLMAWGMFSRPVGDYYVNHPQETILLPRSLFNVVLFLAYGYRGKYLEDFAVGMLISALFVYVHTTLNKQGLLQWLQRRNIWVWRAGILLWMFVAMEYYMEIFHYRWPVLADLPQLQFWQYELGFAVSYGCCILAVLFDTGGLQWLFSCCPLRWFGKISYSIYIWHLPLLIVFLVHFGLHFGGMSPYLVFFWYWLWALVVIFPCCFWLYVLIEKPGMRLSDRLRTRLLVQVLPPTQVGAKRPSEDRC